MLDFEIPRYQAALKAFDEAFALGYAEGEKELAGGAERLPDVSSVFTIDVPCNDVLDDLWRPYTPRFREAGRVAALASRRRGRAILDPHEAREGSRSSFEENVFRWHVILNPISAR